MHKVLTRDTWLATASHNALTSAAGGRMPKGFRCNWWINREIRVFWQEGIPRQTAEVITDACRERIADCHLPLFDFKLFGPHWSVDEQIVQSLRGNQIDDEKFNDLCLRERWRDEELGGRQHGDIVITRHPLEAGSVHWGSTGIKNGVILFALHGNRPRNHSFLWNVAKHEMGHLLGAAWHCDERTVEGYQYEPHCNMHYSCAGEKLCLKCKDFIRQWWSALGVI